ncbi:hypothetical protein GCM10010172_35330 [Paractinoplanes ferrugineus]|uniref:Uncharacterized protein n=1 Tax=Paractinoplanes ferrugineus TaxID=113564 RepID=A0A919MQW7_9ACTN|nr:hypothetical protein [Actinoplanes ferrugineus]GIE16757.1 hypothetical protein Afe05nite_85970 [Actinoplanes ferrugineus]
MFALKLAVGVAVAVVGAGLAVYACVCLAIRQSKPCADPSQHPLVRARKEVQR